MQLWLVLGLSSLLLVWFGVFWGPRIELDLRGLGHPTGQWSLAMACGVGPVAISGVAASGAPARWLFHLGGHRYPLPAPRRALGPVLSRILSRARMPRRASQPEDSSGDRVSNLLASMDWNELGGWLELMLKERHRVRVIQLDIDLVYGFSDIALTGRIAGALYALAGALPARVRLSQRATWGGEESWQVGCSGVIQLFPALVLTEVLWYILRRRRVNS